MIDFENNTVSLDYLKKVLRIIKNDEHGRGKDFIDSLSNNQFNAKENIIDFCHTYGILNKDLNVVILGSWYGSILIPALAPLVNQISVYDVDETTISISKNLFDYDNVDYNTADIFKEYNKKSFSTPNTLIINTSCEHMHPMNQWKGWKSGQNKLYFAVQSNDMFDIEGHVNCVNFIDEFKKQMPERSVFLVEKEIDDTRGTRFFLFGRILSNDEWREKYKKLEEKQQKALEVLKKDFEIARPEIKA